MAASSGQTEPAGRHAAAMDKAWRDYNLAKLRRMQLQNDLADAHRAVDDAYFAWCDAVEAQRREADDAARCPGCGRPPGECGPACPAARSEGSDG